MGTGSAQGQKMSRFSKLSKKPTTNQKQKTKTHPHLKKQGVQGSSISPCSQMPPGKTAGNMLRKTTLDWAVLFMFFFPSFCSLKMGSGYLQCYKTLMNSVLPNLNKKYA